MTIARDKKVASLLKKKLQVLGKEKADPKEKKGLKKEIREDLKKKRKQNATEEVNKKKDADEELKNILIAIQEKHAKEKSSEKEMWKALAQAEAKFWSKQKKLKQKQKIACLPKSVQLKNLLSKIRSQEIVADKQGKEGKSKKEGKDAAKPSLSLNKQEKKLMREIEAFKKATKDGDKLTEEELIKALINDLKEKDLAKKCSVLRVQLNLNPERQEDQDVKDFYTNNIELEAKRQTKDILTNYVHLKEFREENSGIFKRYNNLLAMKKKEKSFQRLEKKRALKQKLKAERKQATEALKAEEGRVSTDSGINKKKKFDEEENGSNIASTKNEESTESGIKQKKKISKKNVENEELAEPDIKQKKKAKENAENEVKKKGAKKLNEEDANTEPKSKKKKKAH